MKTEKTWKICDEEKDKAIKEYNKFKDTVIVIGDFNGKIGFNRKDDIIRRF